MAPYTAIELKESILTFGKKKYYLGDTIGKGTYSKVRAAIMKKDGERSRLVACKIINKQEAGKEFVNKFLPRELRILRGISHQHIVSIIDILEMDNHVFILMSYCKYGDLLDYIRQRGSCTENRSKHFFKQLVSAVYYLHNKDIAHRDLKCENIFLYGKTTLKLGDFGFSRFCKNENTGGRVLSKTYCGSAAYAAPEIIEGAPYNPKMYDVWSLGCILYIMIAGQMPFDDSNIKKMLKYQKNRGIFLQIWCCYYLSDAIKQLLIQILEPDVTKRATINVVAQSKWLRELSSPITDRPGPSNKRYFYHDKHNNYSR